MEIKELRSNKRVTQKELARRLNSTFQYISNIETGNKKESLDMYAKICIALGYTETETLKFIAERLGFGVYY